MKITIAGCGNMGLIYARAFLKYNIVSKEELLLIEKNESRKTELGKLDIGRVVTPADEAIKSSDVLILAVKPQDFKELQRSLRQVLSPHAIVLSIMAGTEIPAIQQMLAHKKVIRAMPNSPVEVGMGITAYAMSSDISIQESRLIENLLSTTGRTLYIGEEEQLNAVTALSGSGPAYFFYFMKQLIEAGVKMGLSEQVSSMLARQTMLGSFHLINNASRPLDELINAVASKGGTTEAALAAFSANEVGMHIQEGLLNAMRRAEELAKADY